MYAVAKLTALIVVLELMACVPLPHEEIGMPELIGTVSENGLPVTGAVVMYCRQANARETCNSFDSTNTDKQGQFHFPKKMKFAVMLPIYGDFFDQWTIKVRRKEQELVTGFTLGLPAPTKVILACEITEGLKCQQLSRTDD